MKPYHVNLTLIALNGFWCWCWAQSPIESSGRTACLIMSAFATGFAAAFWLAGWIDENNGAGG